jgi:hypothetical protein
VNGKSDRAHRTLFTVHRLLFTLFLIGCDPTLPPLRGKMEAGRDPYAVFVGGGELDSDLYAVRPDGGSPVQITFTNVAELKPALSPDGVSLAFLRGASLNEAAPATVWVMSLENGAERELPLPQGAGAPRRIGWEATGNAVIVETRKGLYRLMAPPAEPDAQPVPRGQRASAESTLAVLLGDPVFTQVVRCRASRDLCIQGASGRQSLLAQGVRGAVRWGSDSVAFFVGNRLQIRPLRQGRPRILMMSHAPEKPREMTFFPGER